MSTIVLIRPGSTDFDEQQRIQGSLNLPLNARGEQQVQQAIEQLRTVPLDVVYTSPCDPARSTAHQIGDSLGIPVKELEDLTNLNQGLWEGSCVEELRRKHPKVLRQWQESPETICPPGGEMFSEAVERVRRALAKPMKKQSNFAVVASDPLATVIRCIIRGCKPEGISLCGEIEGPAWEYLKTNGHQPAFGAFTPAPAATAPNGATPALERVVVPTRGENTDEFHPEA